MDFTKPLMFAGDFNIPFNLKPHNVLSRKLSYSNIIQHVQCPTHNLGNILDHIYCHPNDFRSYFIHSVYYTDHEAICSTFQH